MPEATLLSPTGAAANPTPSPLRSSTVRHDETSRPRRLRPAVWWIGVLVTLGGVFLALLVRCGALPGQSRPEVTILTGPPDGTYHALGQALAEEISDFVRPTVLTTAGSLDNVSRIAHEGGNVIAFVQSDAPPNHRLRLLAPLYVEPLHILVGASSGLSDLADLAQVDPVQLSLGARDSGTRQASCRLLEQFELGFADCREREGSALAEVADGLHEGAIAADFVLSAVPAARVQQLLAGPEPAARLLSLQNTDSEGGLADAMAMVDPEYLRVVIPRGTYGRYPEQAVVTIGVEALLVASEGTSTNVARQVVERLFAARARIAQRPHTRIARRFRERYDPATAVFPYHQGAVAYYQRDLPPLVVRYAELFSFLLAILIATGSGVITLREWGRRRKKNRIDDYYLEIERSATQTQQATREQLLVLRDTLEATRRRAFQDLVDERLEADDSFKIFQDFTQNELLRVNARLDVLERG